MAMPGIATNAGCDLSVVQRVLTVVQAAARSSQEANFFACDVGRDVEGVFA